MIRHLTKHDHLPDYSVSFDPKNDMVTFRNRGSMSAALPTAIWSTPLDPDGYHEARLVAPGWDIHYLELEWRRWLGENEIEPKYPERHFVKFCQSWHERRGSL